MARTDSLWEDINGGTAIQTIAPLGYDILINGLNKYLNFNTDVGSSGYGIRDNNGVIEIKNFGGSWASPGGGTLIAPLYSATPIFLPTGYKYVQQITLSHTNTSGADVANVAVPIKIVNNSALFLHAQYLGYDVRFYDANMNPLTFEREFYYSASGLRASFWVLIPNYSHTTDTVIYMVYGNASATDASNPSGVWNSNYLGVYHLADGADGSSSTLNGNDSTGNANMTTIGTGGTVSFPGLNTSVSRYACNMADQHFTRTYIGLPAGASPRVFEFYLGGYNGSSSSTSLLTYGSGSGSFEIRFQQNTGDVLILQGGSTIVTTNLNILQGAGTLLTIVYDGTKFYFYQNGGLAYISGNITLNTTLGTTSLGLNASSGGFTEIVDEFRILTTIPTNVASYVSIQSNLMLPAQAFTLGTEVTTINSEVAYGSDGWEMIDGGIEVASFSKTNGVTVSNLKIPNIPGYSFLYKDNVTGNVSGNGNLYYLPAEQALEVPQIGATTYVINGQTGGRVLVYNNNMIQTTPDIQYPASGGKIGLLMADTPTQPFQLGGDYIVDDPVSASGVITYVASPAKPYGEEIQSVNYIYAIPDVTGLTYSETPDPSGFLANGTSYQYDVYSWDGSNFNTHSVNVATISFTDPNDGNYYGNQLNWDDVNTYYGSNYVVVRTITYPDTSTETNYQIVSTNSYYDTPNSLAPGNPITTLNWYISGHSFTYNFFGAITLPSNNILYSYTGYNTLDYDTLTQSVTNNIGNLSGFSASQSGSGNYNIDDSVWYEAYEELDVDGLSVFSPTDGGNSGSPVVINTTDVGIDLNWTPDSAASQYVLIRHWTPAQQLDVNDPTDNGSNIDTSAGSFNNQTIALTIWGYGTAGDSTVVYDANPLTLNLTDITTVSDPADNGTATDPAGGDFTTQTLNTTIWAYTTAPDSTVVYDASPLTGSYSDSTDPTWQLDLDFNSVPGATSYILQVFDGTNYWWIDTLGSTTYTVNDSTFSGWLGGTPTPFSPTTTSPYAPATDFECNVNVNMPTGATGIILQATPDGGSTYYFIDLGSSITFTFGDFTNPSWVSGQFTPGTTSPYYYPGTEVISYMQTTSTSFTDDGTTGWNSGSYDVSQKLLWYNISLEANYGSDFVTYQTIDGTTQNYLYTSGSGTLDFTDSPASIWTGTASVFPTTNVGYWDNGTITALKIFSTATFSGQKVMSVNFANPTATDDNANDSYYYITWTVSPGANATGTIWENITNSPTYYIENTAVTLYDDNTIWTNSTPIVYPTATLPSIVLDSNSRLLLTGLPTSSAGLNPGTLWNNGGTIAVA